MSSSISFDNQGFATSSGLMTVYDYDPSNGLFREPFETWIVEGAGVPAHSTAIAPPSAQPNTAPVWDADKQEWHLVESHIGQTVWDKATGQSVHIDTLGPLPETCTETQPTEAYMMWDEASGKWVIDANARLNALKDQAQAAMQNVQQQASMVTAMGETFGTEMRDYVGKLRAILSGTDTTSTELPTPPNDPTL